MGRFLVLVTIFYANMTKGETLMNITEAILLDRLMQANPEVFEIRVQVWEDDSQ